MIKIIFADYDNMKNEMLVKQLNMLKERYKCKLILFDGPMEDEDGTKASWCTEKRPGMFDDYCFSYGGKNLVGTMLAYCTDAEIDPTEAMFVSDNDSERDVAKGKGMEVRSPKAMAEAYRQALEMLTAGMKPKK